MDNHALLRTGVVNIIKGPDLQAVAEPTNGAEGVAAFAATRPDAALIDLRMPVMEGGEAVRRIRAIDPLAKVLV